MAKVNKWITIRKSLFRGAQCAAVTIAALQTVPVPEGIGVERQVTVSFIIGALGAIAKGIQNYKKTKARRETLSGYILALVGLSVVLSGCVTTTAPDGTVTTSVDHAALESTWAALERLQAQRDRLETEPQTPVVQVELSEVERQIEAARAKLEDMTRGAD